MAASSSKQAASSGKQALPSAPASPAPSPRPTPAPSPRPDSVVEWTEQQQASHDRAQAVFLTRWPFLPEWSAVTDSPAESKWHKYTLINSKKKLATPIISGIVEVKDDPNDSYAFTLCIRRNAENPAAAATFDAAVEGSKTLEQVLMDADDTYSQLERRTAVKKNSFVVVFDEISRIPDVRKRRLDPNIRVVIDGSARQHLTRGSLADAIMGKRWSVKCTITPVGLVSERRLIIDYRVISVEMTCQGEVKVAKSLIAAAAAQQQEDDECEEFDLN